jgi:predicted nucleotidyltransferase
LRGEAHLASIAAVLDVLHEAQEQLVFLGGCVPAFYARATGAPIRATKDVDCMSTMSPWVLQEQMLARLCAFGQLAPVTDTQFRYQVPGTDLVIDVMSPDGFNIGGGTRWMREAAEHAMRHVLPDGRTVRVVTPPYFVLLKLAAFLDRGLDLISGKDMEDLVFMAIEVDDLAEQVSAAGLAATIAAQWREVFRKHGIDTADIPDIVDFHLHPDDVGRRDRAVTTITALATADVARP